MSDKYDEFIKAMRESGEVPDQWVDGVEKTFQASTLRNELKETKEQYRNILQQNETYRNGILRDRFKALGIGISPKALNIPADLDPTDEDKVSAWAQEMELIPKVETTEPSERAVHDRIAAASNEGGNSSIPSTSDIQNLSEEEFWKVAMQREAALKGNR